MDFPDILQLVKINTDEQMGGMQKKLKDHEQNCFAFTAQRTEFPEDPVVKF